MNCKIRSLACLIVETIWSSIKADYSRGQLAHSKLTWARVRQLYVRRHFLQCAVVVANETDRAVQGVRLRAIPNKRISTFAGQSRSLEESITRLVLWRLTVVRIDFLDPGGSCAIDGYK